MNINFSLKNFLNSEPSNTNQTIDSLIKSIVNQENIQAIDLRQLVVGQTFSGQIIDIHNKDIQIQTADSQILHAKLLDMLNLNIGDTITFQVKESGSSQIIIKPIDNKEIMNSIITKALTNANLQLSDTNSAVVKELVNQNMPIDKQTIQNTLKYVISYPETNINQIVTMQKLGIAITPNTVSQFALYAKGEHQIVNQLNIFVEEVYQSLTNNVQNNDINKAIAITKQINEVLIPIKFTDEENVFTLQGTQKNELLSLINNLVKTDSTLQAKHSITIAETISDLVETKQTVNSNDDTIRYKDTSTLIKNTINEEVANPHQDSVKITRMITTLIDKLSEDGVLNKDAVKQLMESNVFKEVFKEQFAKSLFINPSLLNQVDEKAEYISTVYKTIEETIEKLSKIFTQSENSNTSLQNCAQNIKSNLDFMQSLNQIFPYIQIPLKLKDYHGHGDLYIYNKSAKKLSNDEQVSAFLHLDLEYLGATDVDIKMLRKQVKTEFTLQDKDSMDLVEKNLPELKEKLEKRGYQVEYTIKQTDTKVDENTGLHTLFTSNEPKQTVKRYTFDVRM